MRAELLETGLRLTRETGEIPNLDYVAALTGISRASVYRVVTEQFPDKKPSDFFENTGRVKSAVVVDGELVYLGAEDIKTIGENVASKIDWMDVLSKLPKEVCAEIGRIANTLVEDPSNNIQKQA